jgi:hypothetical protein
MHERQPAARRPRDTPTRYVPAAYEIQDSAGKALAQFGLAPGDARLVVIPSSAQAERKLTQSPSAAAPQSGGLRPACLLRLQGPPE